MNDIEKDDLIHVIESLRLDMIKTGLIHGLTSKKAIQISKKLDHHIVQYQTMYMKADNKKLNWADEGHYLPIYSKLIIIPFTIAFTICKSFPSLILWIYYNIIFLIFYIITILLHRIISGTTWDNHYYQLECLIP